MVERRVSGLREGHYGVGAAGTKSVLPVRTHALRSGERPSGVDGGLLSDESRESIEPPKVSL